MVPTATAVAKDHRRGVARAPDSDRAGHIDRFDAGKGYASASRFLRRDGPAVHRPYRFRRDRTLWTYCAVGKDALESQSVWRERLFGLTKAPNVNKPRLMNFKRKTMIFR